MPQTSRSLTAPAPSSASRPVVNHCAPPSRSWFVWLALGSVMLLASLVAGSVYLVSKLPRRPDVVCVEKTNPPETAAPPVLSTEQPKTLPDSPKPTPPTGGNEERYLTALGSLTAAHQYQAYLNLGLLADAWEKDVYDEEEAMKLLAVVQGMIEGVDRQLVRIEKASTKEDDRQALACSRELGALLKTQAKELAAYWEGGEKEHVEAFHKARTLAWARLKELLKLED